MPYQTTQIVQNSLFSLVLENAWYSSLPKETRFAQIPHHRFSDWCMFVPCSRLIKNGAILGNCVIWGHFRSSGDNLRLEGPCLCDP